MAFDITTAKPVNQGGFDLSTAKPVEDEQTGWLDQATDVVFNQTAATG